MIEKLQKIWDSVRGKICPKRVYRYGTISLFYFDDRTRLEKMCDIVDEWFFEKRQMSRFKRAIAPRVINWIDGLGNSSDEVKQSEKKGYAYMSDREWQQMANKSRKDIEAKRDAKIRAKAEFAASEIKKGRKYNTPESWAKALDNVKRFN